MITDSFIEYRTTDGEAWRIEAGSALLEKFEISGSENEVMEILRLWHDALKEQGQAWNVVCRSYAVNPVLGVEDAEHLRPWSAEEIATAFGVRVDAVVDGAVKLWKKIDNIRRQRSERKSEPVEEKKKEMSEEDKLHLLAQHGFVSVKSAAERDYIVGRIQALELLLESEHQRSMARSLISQECMLFFVIEPSLRNLQETISNSAMGSKDLEDRLAKLVSSRNNAQSQIESTMKAVGISEAQTSSLRRGRQFQDCLGTIISAVREYCGRGDTELIDGIFTEAEVEVLTQELTVRPAQYRPDLVVIAPTCIEGLFDPDFEPPKIPRRAHRRLRAGFKKGLADARAEDGEDVEELDSESREDAREEIVSEAERDGGTGISGTLPGGAAAAPPAQPSAPTRRNRGDDLTEF